MRCVVVRPGWYADPLGAAELRWYDGAAWTWQVATAGRAWLAPYGKVVAAPPEDAPVGGGLGAGGAAPPPPRFDRSPFDADDLVVARSGQPRGPGAWLDLYDADGLLGHFVEKAPADLLDAVIVSLGANDGAPLLTILHPGRRARARVDGPDGTLGFLSRIGRVRANIEVHGPGRRPDGPPLAVLRPTDGNATWEARDPSAELVARIRAWVLGAKHDRAYVAARYTLHMGPAATPELRRLLVATPVLIDRAVVQDGREPIDRARRPLRS
jgi:hypothetical protein